MAQVPLPCFFLLFLLDLVGPSQVVLMEPGNGSRAAAWTLRPRQLESGEEEVGLGSELAGKYPTGGGGPVLAEKIPQPGWEAAATQASGARWAGEVAEERSPEETPTAGPSPTGLPQTPSNSSSRRLGQQCGSWLVKTGLVCALGVLVMVGNGAVIAVIASSVSGWSHSSRLVLLSLAATDAALSLLVVPLNLYRSLGLGLVGAEERAGEGEAPYCRAVAFINSSIFGASLYSLAGVSLERYVAIFFPLRYGHLLSPRRVALLIATAWLLPVLVLLPLAVPGPRAVLRVRFSGAALLCEPDYGSNTAYSLVMAGTVFCPAAGTITFANLRLWLAARAQSRRGKGPGEEARLKRHCLLPLDNASRILGPVVVAFYVCWAPCIGTILYNAITQERVHEWVEFVALWLPTGSGFLNCFVYFWVNRSFRHKFQKVGHQLCRPCCCRLPPQHHLPTISAAVEEGCVGQAGPPCSLSSSSSLLLSQGAQTSL
ncbi:melatonin receptor type 1B-B-like [Hemicordylus capensis]|uniref:melatonin receptor type 1B-B-like n=1 Tax=Hemicordylus capensis TaxID=884348 RepID=UPI0023026723|nr:melatonin receptor type 1B-B-like [Hemicordylus capensis]